MSKPDTNFCLVDFEPQDQYAFVVSACSKYIPELAALLNSLVAIGSTADVHIIGYELDQIGPQLVALPYQAVLHPVSYEEARAFGGESEILCRKRYFYAACVGEWYKAVCILDADMVFVRPVTTFFDIARDSGKLLGASLEQKRMYGDNAHHTVGEDGNWTRILTDDVWNPRDICCAPIFADMSRWCPVFKQSWAYYLNGFRAPDMEAINIAILEKHLSDEIVMLSNVQWVGTNEKLLKPYIRAIGQERDPDPGGKLWTETGDPLYIIHGQFVKQKWRDQQILSRFHCIKGYIGGSTKCCNMAVGALEGLWQYFRRCLEGGPISVEKRAYTVNGEWGEHCLSFDPLEEKYATAEVANDSLRI